MYKTLLLTAFSALLFSASATAQNNPDAGSGKTEKLFYAEFGGANVLFGANFDWRFKKNTRTGLGARVGLGFTVYDKEIQNGNSWDYETTTIATIPLGLNYVFGKPNSPSMFEVGAGATVLMPKASVYRYDDDKEGNLIGHFSFMYRRVPIEGGFSWRIGFTPIINTSGQIFPSGAVGLGYAFK
jgi:hypothetical protein